MRIAVVSDIHGNLAALEAVLADLRKTSPDLILHGGDLAHGGSNPGEVLDCIRGLGWQGVLGNADEMLFAPETLTAFASRLPQLQSMFAAIEEMALWTREALGQERIGWLSGLPLTLTHSPLAVVHATGETTWRSPGPQSSDAELEMAYASLGQPVVAYGHIHCPFVRPIGALTVVNTGSVSLSYDGDPRASYLLLDEGAPTIRRVEYEVAREVAALRASGMPHAEWTIRMLESASPKML
jgi:putative phosphoesterase